MIHCEIQKIEDLNLWKATATLNLPSLTIVKYQAEKRNFERSISREFSDIIDQYIEKNLDI